MTITGHLIDETTLTSPILSQRPEDVTLRPACLPLFAYRFTNFNSSAYNTTGNELGSELSNRDRLSAFVLLHVPSHLLTHGNRFYE